MIILLFAILLACQSAPIPVAKALVQDTLTYNSISEKQKEIYVAKIQPLYNEMLLKKRFNGSILLAKNGEIVFEDYHGFINFETKDSITPNTPFHLASISKTFTAMTILRLMEQGKLKLEDNVQQYLPSFPYNNITIKNLLTHRSGLANYVHFMEDNEVVVTRRRNRRGRMVRVSRVVKKAAPHPSMVTNADVLAYMVTNKIRPQTQPDHSFNYCNTNYALLALIIEKVTGLDFPTYMHDSVFVPLGMNHSFIFCIKDCPRYIPSYQPSNAPFKLESLDAVYGDKNVYSTVRDMLLWDRALYQNKFLHQETLEMAYRPYSKERKSSHNYGLGWRLLVRPTDTVVYHNGWWHGNNTVFTRLIKDTATLIVLGNRFNRAIYKAKEMTSVLTGKIDTTKLEE